MLLLVFTSKTMEDNIHHGCCDTCKHYKRILLVSAENGERTMYGYCHASRNYAKHDPSDTCKRWSADPKSIERL